MKNIIKKSSILLFLSLYPVTQLLSQTISDSILVKTTAIIFAEHEKLSIENPLLKEQIKSLEELNQLYIKSDSIQNKEIELYKEKVVSNDKEIQRLKSSRKNIVKNSCVGGIVLFIIGLIL